ncbi:hypothetical protein B0G80_2083 [Paraburkholderia sp. BL6669N2]|nr:hypothetical protein B0G80_2083 [Paraburkholderia sp. BL6669N2]
MTDALYQAAYSDGSGLKRPVFVVRQIAHMMPVTTTRMHG